MLHNPSPPPATEYKHTFIIHDHTAGRWIDGQRYMHMREKLRHKGNPKDLLLRQQCKHEMIADRKHTAKSENKIMLISCKMKITDDKDSVGKRHLISSNNNVMSETVWKVKHWEGRKVENVRQIDYPGKHI